MFSNKLEDAFNKHINAEMYSAYLYLSMSAYFEFVGLAGFANWMRVQAQEEMSHSHKFYNYMNERAGRVKFGAIAEPPSEWSNSLQIFEEIMAHEKKVTSLINDLVDLAIDERDHASNNFLQWFVAEQVEEEASVGAVLDKLNLVNDDPGGMFALNQEMATRVFVAPA